MFSSLKDRRGQQKIYTLDRSGEADVIIRILIGGVNVLTEKTREKTFVKSRTFDPNHVWPVTLWDVQIRYMKEISVQLENENHILVLRDHDPFGQHQESRPLEGPDFLSMRRVFVSYSQPIRFVRFDGKSKNSGLPVFDPPRVRDSWCRPTKRIAASGNENEKSRSKRRACVCDKCSTFFFA